MTAVIFDFNGTLIFDDEYHKTSWGIVYNLLTSKNMTDDFKNTYLGGRNDDVLRLMDSSLDDEELKMWSERKEAIYRKVCMDNKDTFHLVKGAEDVFDYLKSQGIPFTIASASIKDNMDFFFEYFDLNRWFDMDKIAYDDGTYENKEEMYKGAARLIGADLQDTIIFEDSRTGITAAKSLKPKLVIAVGNEEKHSYQKEAGADLCIRDYTDIKDIKQLFR